VSARTLPAPDWGSIRLVAFDVDGTLYDQRGLRLCMLREMVIAAVQQRRVDFIKILRIYRHLREELGERMEEDFERQLVAQVAARVGCTEERVRTTALEWLEQRPLRHLARYRFPHLQELFQGLRRRGKTIGVLSDYPARDKLTSLGLAADLIVSAGDEGVRVLKPHPRGLQALMARAGATPEQTILIGDRPERDGEAARAANAHCLILSRKTRAGWHTFSRYDDPLFAAMTPVA
jgi:putative hydrolase of the HAD superfamily